MSLTVLLDSALVHNESDDSGKLAQSISYLAFIILSRYQIIAILSF